MVGRLTSRRSGSQFVSSDVHRSPIRNYLKRPLLHTQLRRRFEHESKRELYAAEFHARQKQPTEDWASFGEDLKTLVDKAFPDIEEAARERMAVDRFLSQIIDPQLAFSVQPKNLDEVVTYTMQMQSHLSLSSRGSSGVALAEASVAAVDLRQQDTKILDTLHQLVTRIEKLETDLSTSQSQGANRDSHPGYSRQRSNTRRRMNNQSGCYQCGEEGHYARNCLAPRPRFIQRKQGN